MPFEYIVDHGQSSSPVGKTCLSPISLIELYVPEPVNTTQQNPIYKSSMATSKRGSRSVVDHDHDHDNDDEHPSDKDSQLATDFNAANVQITPDTFLSMCPALLVQIEQGSCNERHNEADETDPIIKDPRRDNETRNIGKQKMKKKIGLLNWARRHCENAGTH